tara:strand:+ start:496 stop:2388 length:1893 start_codon:yes stop_codon:yes gene_type:complete
MVDSIANATTGLKDLNASAKESEKIFSGFLGTMVEVAAKTDGAGKAWTTFSRLTSGSPIWKIQNKARAYLSILAGFQSRGLAAEKASRANNKAFIDSASALTKMGKELDELNDIFDMVAHGFDTFSDSQLEALKSTDAYATAIMNGVKENEALSNSLTELNDLYDINEERINNTIEARKKVLAFEKALKSPAGRERINKEIIKLESEAKDKSAFIKRDTNNMDGFKFSAYKKLKKQFAEKKKAKEEKLAKETRKEFWSDLKSFGVGKGFFKNMNESLGKMKKNTGVIAFIARTASAVSLYRSKIGLKFRKSIMKLTLGIQPLLSLMFKGFVFLILGVVLFMVFAKIAHDIFDVMKDFGVMDDISRVLSSAVAIIGNIFSIFGAFMSGDFTAMFDYLNDILDEVITIAWSLALAAAKIGFAILVGLFYSLIDFIDYFFFQDGWRVVLPALLKIGSILLIAYFVKWSIGQALLLLGIYALPIGMAIVVAAGVVALYRKLEPFATWIKVIVGIALLIVGFIIGWPILIGVAIGLLISALAGKFKFFKKATGGTSHGGMTLVGEQGPELVNLPAGATVKTNTQTNKMMGGTTINNYITINAKDTSKAEMKRIANELSNMINMKVNRSFSIRTMR